MFNFMRFVVRYDLFSLYQPRICNRLEHLWIDWTDLLKKATARIELRCAHFRPVATYIHGTFSTTDQQKKWLSVDFFVCLWANEIQNRSIDFGRVK